MGLVHPVVRGPGSVVRASPSIPDGRHPAGIIPSVIFQYVVHDGMLPSLMQLHAHACASKGIAEGKLKTLCSY